MTEQHFRTLGLQRGCTEEEMKKAYRTKALQFHPDRNPNGADVFKQINAAYEALVQHYKQNGGRDVIRGGGGGGFSGAGMPNMYGRSPTNDPRPSYYGDHNAQSSYYGARQSTQSSSAMPDASMWSQYYKAAAKAAASSKTNASRKPEKNENEKKSSDFRWRQAHGSRVPASGYAGSPNTTDTSKTSPPPRTTADYVDKKFSVPLFTSAPRTFAELKFMFDQLYTKTEYVRDTLPNATEEEKRVFNNLKEAKLQAMWENLNKLQSDEEKRRQLKAEWEQTEEALKERVDYSRMSHFTSPATDAERQRTDEERIAKLKEDVRKAREDRERKEKERLEKETRAKAAADAAAERLFSKRVYTREMPAGASDTEKSKQEGSAGKEQSPSSPLPPRAPPPPPAAEKNSNLSAAKSSCDSGASPSEGVSPRTPVKESLFGRPSTPDPVMETKSAATLESERIRKELEHEEKLLAEMEAAAAAARERQRRKAQQEAEACAQKKAEAHPTTPLKEQGEEKRKKFFSEWEQMEDYSHQRGPKQKTTAATFESREAERRDAMRADKDRIDQLQEEARRAREQRDKKDRHEKSKAAANLAAERRRGMQEEQRDRVLEDKRRLIRRMFGIQYTPDPAEACSMSDMELYTLLSLLRENAERVESMLDGRMTGGPCSRCRSEPKETHVLPFKCSHACVCQNCIQQASQCPLCGAAVLATATRSKRMGASAWRQESDGQESSSSPGQSPLFSQFFPSPPPHSSDRRRSPLDVPSAASCSSLPYPKTPVDQHIPPLRRSSSSGVQTKREGPGSPFRPTKPSTAETPRSARLDMPEPSETKLFSSGLNFNNNAGTPAPKETSSDPYLSALRSPSSPQRLAPEVGGEKAVDGRSGGAAATRGSSRQLSFSDEEDLQQVPLSRQRFHGGSGTKQPGEEEGPTPEKNRSTSVASPTPPSASDAARDTRPSRLSTSNSKEASVSRKGTSPAPHVSEAKDVDSTLSFSDISSSFTAAGDAGTKASAERRENPPPPVRQPTTEEADKSDLGPQDATAPKTAAVSLPSPKSFTAAAAAAGGAKGTSSPARSSVSQSGSAVNRGAIRSMSKAVPVLSSREESSTKI